MTNTLNTAGLSAAERPLVEAVLARLQEGAYVALVALPTGGTQVLSATRKAGAPELTDDQVGEELVDLAIENGDLDPFTAILSQYAVFTPPGRVRSDRERGPRGARHGLTTH